MNADELEIKKLIDSWVVWRDAGMWDRLRTVWHDDGGMAASWRQGTADQFIAANREGWSKGLDILHLLGGSRIDVAGDRAISITKMVISQRTTLHGTLCDVSCFSRHYDFWDRRNGRWGLVQRETIFDRDRLDVVNPGETVTLEQDRLARFPKNYQHLAYLQSMLGYAVREDMPCLRSEAAERLYAQGQRWLDGAAMAPQQINSIAA